jgi:hypothetical protein
LLPSSSTLTFPSLFNLTINICLAPYHYKPSLLSTMGTKRRASELDHEAKKMKSDDSNGHDKVSPRDWVQTTPRTRKVLPRQPITDLDDLPEAARQQFDYLLQAIGDASPEILYQVNLVDQINAINSDGPLPPSFKYAPPPMNIIVGHDMHSTFPIAFC